MLRALWIGAVLALLTSHALAQPGRDNARLEAIFKQDQQTRSRQPIDWKVVSVQDKEHRIEVLDLLKSGKVVTAKDHFHAAMVYQHGDSLDDYRLAFALAQVAATLDPSLKSARWLTAAAWDRMLMKRNVPQWYGTQYHQPVPGGPMALYPVNEAAVTDAERAEMNAPSLQEAKDRLKQVNAK
ncbi:hypothetical protein [Dokdonella sp.]|uniref:hypothetical protein n=1 Tax=Dokdonella sp. TaxID=2291710 RepID=UPI00260CE6D0|nr:hypothetical protein [Dokdonella sp.]